MEAVHYYSQNLNIIDNDSLVVYYYEVYYDTFLSSSFANRIYVLKRIVTKINTVECRDITNLFTGLIPINLLNNSDKTGCDA